MGPQDFGNAEMFLVGFSLQATWLIVVYKYMSHSHSTKDGGVIRLDTLWRHDMEMLSDLLAPCDTNPPASTRVVLSWELRDDKNRTNFISLS